MTKTTVYAGMPLVERIAYLREKGNRIHDLDVRGRYFKKVSECQTVADAMGVFSWLLEISKEQVKKMSIIHPSELGALDIEGIFPW